MQKNESRGTLFFLLFGACFTRWPPGYRSFFAFFFLRFFFLRDVLHFLRIFFFANLYVGKCTSYASLTTGADFFLAFFFFFFFFALGFFAFFAFFAGFLAAFFAYTYFGLSKTVCYPLDCGTLG